MKNFALGMVLGSMIVTVSAFGQEVKPGAALDISTRERGSPIGADLMIGTGGNGLFLDASLIAPSESNGHWSPTATIANGNIALSPVGVGVQKRSSTGYMAASISPLANAYIDKDHGLFWMPLSAQACFQKSLNDWLDIEGSINTGIVTNGFFSYDGEDPLSFVQGTARMQANVTVGEGTSLSPFVVYNGRTGDQRINGSDIVTVNGRYVPTKYETTSFGTQRTVTAGVALKVAF